LATIAVALVLVCVTGAAAQQVYTGTVLRIDPSAGVIVFQDGRMFQTTADTVIISGNQRVLLGSLSPGTPVTLYTAQPVALRDGRYVLLSESGARAAPGSTMATAPPGPTTAVVTSPGATTVVTPPGTVVQSSPFEVAGYVAGADEAQGTIIFDDGRKVRTGTDTQVLMHGVQPVALSTLKPGTYVVVRSVRPFGGARGEWFPMAEVARGTVVRVEQPGVIVLNDGRRYRTTGDTVVYVDRRAVPVTTVQPGTRVVVYQNGSTTTVVSEPAASPPLLVPEAGLQHKEHDRPSQ
jgi:hypothetical protein